MVCVSDIRSVLNVIMFHKLRFGDSELNKCQSIYAIHLVIVSNIARTMYLIAFGIHQV